MPTIQIDDPDDPRLSDYVALRDTSLRRHLESAEGLFIAEGDKVIRRAIEAGYRPRSFLLSARWLPSLDDVIQRCGDVPLLVVSENLAEQVTGFHVHRGALASLHRESRHTVAEVLQGDRVVVLEDLVDHANVGAVIRTAAAIGWDGVLLSPRSADPLYRRSIKVAMGAVFSLPWARIDAWASAPQLLTDHGYTTLALSLSPDAIDLDVAARAVAGHTKVAILLGTEGTGLSERWAGGADHRVQIPMAAGIDSLNVAAAAAIACWALRRP